MDLPLKQFQLIAMTAFHRPYLLLNLTLFWTGCCVADATRASSPALLLQTRTRIHKHSHARTHARSHIHYQHTQVHVLAHVSCCSHGWLTHGVAVAVAVVAVAVV